VALGPAGGATGEKKNGQVNKKAMREWELHKGEFATRKRTECRDGPIGQCSIGISETFGGKGRTGGLGGGGDVTLRSSVKNRSENLVTDKSRGKSFVSLGVQVRKAKKKAFKLKTTRSATTPTGRGHRFQAGFLIHRVGLNDVLGKSSGAGVTQGSWGAQLGGRGREMKTWELRWEGGWEKEFRVFNGAGGGG